MEIQRTQAITEDSWKVESEPGQIALTPYLLYQYCEDGPLRSTCWEEEQKRSVAGSSSSSESVINVFTFADDDFVKEKDTQMEDQKTTWKKDFMKDLGPGTKLARSKSWQYPRKLPSHSSVPRSYSMNAICTTPFIELLHLLEKSTRSFSPCSFQNTALTSNSKQHVCSATSVHATVQVEDDQSMDLTRIRTDNENWYRLYLEAKKTRQIVAQEPVHCFPCNCSNAQCDGKMAPLAKKDCRTWLWKASQRGHEIERYGLSLSWKKDNRMWLWKTTNALLRKQRRKDIRVFTEVKIE